jgi:cell division protein FtsZ
MGDEVKITVIATGFRQEMPQRRERMMSEATLPTIRRDPPPPPRISQRPSMPRFASEERAEFTREHEEEPGLPQAENSHEYARIFLHDEPAVEAPKILEAAAGEPGAEVSAARGELLPVPASVFDDDFFKRPVESLSSEDATPHDVFPARGVLPDSEMRVQSAAPRTPVFSAYAQAVEPEATDELDIPAFLRRNH